MKATGVKPLKASKRQSGSIQKRGMAAFFPIIEEWKEKLRSEGHGGDWPAHRYKGDGPTIFATMNRDKTNQVFTKIGHNEAMERAEGGKGLYILPFNEEVILDNPGLDEEFEDALKTTDAVERFEYQQLTSSLYPDLSKIDQARRMQESGTFRTMAEITSGTKAPTARPIKVRGMTDKKMRAQVHGLQPTPLETLSATESRRLRKRIQDYIYKQYEAMASAMIESGEISEEEFDTKLKELGADEMALMDALLMGHEKYIDRTPSTINDFNRIIMAYHKMRSKNTPFLREATPSLLDALSQTEGLFEGFEQKFLDAISPTAPNLLQTHTIHLIYDIEGEEIEPKGLNRFFKLIYGEVDAENFVDPAFVTGEAAKSVNRFLAAHEHNGTSAARALIEASRDAFLSKKGIADVGLEIEVGDDSVPQLVATALDAANTARKEHEPFEKLFSIEKDGEQADKEKRRQVMQELVRRGLAFPINAPAYLSNPPDMPMTLRHLPIDEALDVWDEMGAKQRKEVDDELAKLQSKHDKELRMKIKKAEDDLNAKHKAEMATKTAKFDNQEKKLKAKLKATKTDMTEKRRVLAEKKNDRINDLIKKHNKLVKTAKKKDTKLKASAERSERNKKKFGEIEGERRALKKDLAAAKEKHDKAVEDAKDQHAKAIKKAEKKTEEVKDKLLNLQRQRKNFKMTLAKKTSKAIAEVKKEAAELNAKLVAEQKFFSSGTAAGDGFYLIPLFSAGFQKSPKGWNGKWVVPTMQVLDEYAEVMADAKQNISALNLLFLIAARAKALYDYELKESETMLIYSMLDPHDPNADDDDDDEETEVEKALAAAAGRASIYQNPPANILPYGVDPSDLGQPFDSTRSEYIFKRLTKEIKEARSGGTTTPPPGEKTKWIDATGGKTKKDVDEAMILELAAQVGNEQTYDPSEVQASKTFAAPILKETLAKQNLKYPDKEKFEQAARKAFMRLVEAYKTDRKWATSRSGISRPGAFAATDLENAINLLDMPEATGGQIMTKGGEYRIVMPNQQSQYERGGWEPVPHLTAMTNPPLHASDSTGWHIGDKARYNGGHTGHYMSSTPGNIPGEVGEVFTVTKVEVSNWMTEIELEGQLYPAGNPMSFNTSGFDNLGQGLPFKPQFKSFKEELDYMQGPLGNDMNFHTLLLAMSKWDIKNGKYILADYNETFNPAHVQIPYEWAIWAEPHLSAITRDYGLRAIWNGLIQKYQPGPEGKENPPSGMRTKSEVEAAAQTRADKIQAPVYIWYTKGEDHGLYPLTVGMLRPGWAYSEKPPSGGIKYFTIQPSKKKNPPYDTRKPRPASSVVEKFWSWAHAYLDDRIEKALRGDGDGINGNSIRFPKDSDGYDMFMYYLPGALHGGTAEGPFMEYSDKDGKIKSLLKELYNRPISIYRDTGYMGSDDTVVLQPQQFRNPACSYRKTKRSKACGGRVSLMKNGRLYKCADCGAKYEMR